MATKADIWYSVDPGVTMGWARWNRNKLLGCGVISPEEASATWEQRIHSTLLQWECELANNPQANYLLSEEPEFWDTEGGHMAAKRGDLLKLYYAYAGAMTVARISMRMFADGVKVSTWKGQLSKATVVKRCKTQLGGSVVAEFEPDSHAWDAIGVGLWRLGKI